MKYAIMTMNRIVKNEVMENFMIGFMRVKGWGKRKILQRGIEKIDKLRKMCLRDFLGDLK